METVLISIKVEDTTLVQKFALTDGQLPEDIAELLQSMVDNAISKEFEDF